MGKNGRKHNKNIENTEKNFFLPLENKINPPTFLLAVPTKKNNLNGFKKH